METLIATTEGQVILQESEMSDETRRLAQEVARRKLDGFWGAPCCICNRPLYSPDLIAGAQLAGVGSDGRERVAHVTCWQGFVELLRTLPAEWLHELITGKEAGKDGQQRSVS